MIKMLKYVYFKADCEFTDKLSVIHASLIDIKYFKFLLFIDYANFVHLEYTDLIIYKQYKFSMQNIPKILSPIKKHTSFLAMMFFFLGFIYMTTQHQSSDHSATNHRHRCIHDHITKHKFLVPINDSVQHKRRLLQNYGYGPIRMYY